MKIYQVSPWDVVIDERHPRDVRFQRARLEAEGQIEPIEVLVQRTPKRHYLVDPDAWVYAADQVAAARELEWKTILVTY